MCCLMTENKEPKRGLFSRLFGGTSQSEQEAAAEESSGDAKQATSVHDGSESDTTELDGSEFDTTELEASELTTAEISPEMLAAIDKDLSEESTNKSVEVDLSGYVNIELDGVDSDDDVSATGELDLSKLSAKEKDLLSIPNIEMGSDAGDSDAEPVEEKQSGFFSRLKNRLGKTKTGLIDKVRDVITFHGKVDEELFEEIEMLLVQADVGIETTEKIIKKIRKKAAAKRAESAEELIQIFKDALFEIVSHDERNIRLADTPPTVILVVGVNGVGKTTTIGKLAGAWRKAGKRVMLVAGDTFRAAAVEQLSIWAERTGCEIAKKEMGTDPAAVCYEALSSGLAKQMDVILIDTAGRLHTKGHLMDELEKVHRVIKKVMPDAPHETVLILDATTGQNAIMQARAFTDIVQCSGLIMTKLDGTAKGGILIAIRDLFDIPVLKIGIGEEEEDLRDFDAAEYLDALFEK